MKKVLALVLTLSMLVGTLAVGLSAAFEFTASPDGDKFENVYSVPLENNAGRVTYFHLGSPSSANRNLVFDFWFEKEEGGLGVNYGSATYPFVRIDRIGLNVGGEEKTLAYDFEVGEKYNISLRTGGAEAGKTDVKINGQSIGSIDGQLHSGDAIYCGADGILMDNIRLTDGNDTQAEFDFDGTSRGGDTAGDTVAAFEFRRDLGKKYGMADTEAYTFAKVGEGWKNADGTFAIEFDMSFVSNPSTQNELEANGNAPYITNNKIGVGQNVEGQYAEYSFQPDEWYHVKYVSLTDKTEIYVNGVKVEGSFPKMEGMCINDAGYLFWPEGMKMDNLKVGNKAVIDFEENDWNSIFEGCAFSQVEYVGKAVNIWDHIQTKTVEGEATLISPVFNEEKNPNKPNTKNNNGEYTSANANALYLTAKYNNKVGSQYIVNFDLAIYPDKEGTICDDKTLDGAWLEFIVNKFASGDGSRVKIGNKFVGVHKDLYYYGEDAVGATDAVKSMTPWTAGEFHNVAIQVQNGTLTIYLDKEVVYSAPVGMSYWEDLAVLYTNNCGVVIDNFYVYDAKTFDTLVTGLDINDGSDYEKTISDVKATGADACAANGGHIYHWATTAPTKCYEQGTNTYTCYVCGATEEKQEIPMLEHKFQAYDINRVETDEEGNTIAYTKCQESDGCVEKRYVVLPKEEDYTGTLNFFHDFTDDFMKVTTDSSECGLIFEDGVGRYVDSDLNYNRIRLGTNMTKEELNEKGMTYGFDFVYNGTFDTNDTVGNGHYFGVGIGKNLLGTMQAGYDAQEQVFFLRANPIAGGGSKNEKSDVIKLIVGETYNFEVKLYAPQPKGPEDAEKCELALYLNGVKVVNMTGIEVFTLCNYEQNLDSFFFWNFGVAMDMDNYHVGSYDFAWNREYMGDVDGDYSITVEDAALMRQYLAKIIDETGFAAVSRADVNMDGFIDAKDQLRIRKHLAGV